jgi:hypothetical protein
MPLLFLILIILLPLLAVFVAFYARHKGYNFLLFLILSLLTTPVIGLIVAAVLPDKKIEERLLRNLGTNHKTCPTCAEKIKNEALKCRYCGEGFLEESIKALTNTSENLWACDQKKQSNTKIIMCVFALVFLILIIGSM